ncbi:MAG: (d)CMP kinase [Clostridiales bacterium]|nr:(d)CMP kinase [Clostridiales bacterium]
MIIAVDGPAGSGKSTVADIVAKKLGFIHFNSGLLYRGITAYLLKNELDINDVKKEDIILETSFIGDVQHVFVNGEDYTPYLRENIVSINSTIVGKNPITRQIVDDCQRTFCSANNCIIDGRDIGTHVFPNAELKFYVDCNVKVRAKRRFLEEQEKNSNVSLKAIEMQIIERDETDKNRKIAPLVQAPDAIYIDTSDLTIDQVVELMMKYYYELGLTQK